MKYKTEWTKEKDVVRKWYLIDVKDRVLGRSATKIASLLIGKEKPEIVPNIDCGDYVVVINSDMVKLTRGKEKKKQYYTHSTYPGALKTVRFDEQIEKDSRKVIKDAVKNMLPQNKLKDQRLTRLMIYKNSEHKHTAQEPIEIKF